MAAKHKQYRGWRSPDQGFLFPPSPRDWLAVFADLFRQVLMLCQQAGLVKLGHVALDGTKLQGNASKHKAMSYAYMQELERRLDNEIAEMLACAENADVADDDRLGEGNDEEGLPAELKRRSDRLEKLRPSARACR